MQDDLIERLRATRYTERWPGFCTYRAINPDGPEAADRIAALEAKLAEKDALLREVVKAQYGALFVIATGGWGAKKMRQIARESMATLAKIKDATDAD